MPRDPNDSQPFGFSRRHQRWLTSRAYAVHIYTASGVVFALLAAMELAAPQPDPRTFFLWLIVAVIIDATDGPLARAWDVKSRAARIQGRTIDDIVDYLTFTFLPLLACWRLQWLPPPVAIWIAPAMIASLLGFANEHAKQESDGFFLGFPSYWNVYAFYAGLWASPLGIWFNALLIGALTILTVAPVRFIYPNLAPPAWRMPLLAGAVVWTVILVAMLPMYPAVPWWVVAVSLIYPVFYTAVSLLLDFRLRRKRMAS